MAFPVFLLNLTCSTYKLILWYFHDTFLSKCRYPLLCLGRLTAWVILYCQGLFWRDTSRLVFQAGLFHGNVLVQRTVTLPSKIQWIWNRECNGPIAIYYCSSRFYYTIRSTFSGRSGEKYLGP